MATNFPSSLDSLSNPSPTDYQDIVPHSTQHTNLNDIVEALEAKVGVNGSSDTNSLDYKVNQVNPLTTKGDIFVRSATGNTRLPAGPDGYMLVADSTQALGVKYITPSSGGTVTTASIVSANGFTGSVATATTTPAITLGTSITGMVKGNGTAISSATAGTDYYAPSGTDIVVADGGTGVSSLTAYAPIFGGTTGTSAVQSGSVGSAGQVLTSNGAGALPTFQSATGIIGKLTQTTLALPASIGWSSPSGTPPTNYGASTYISEGALLYGTIQLNLSGAYPGGTQSISLIVQRSTDNVTFIDTGFSTGGSTSGTYPVVVYCVVPYGYYRLKLTSSKSDSNSYLSSGTATGTLITL